LGWGKGEERFPPRDNHVFSKDELIFIFSLSSAAIRGRRNTHIEFISTAAEYSEEHLLHAWICVHRVLLGEREKGLSGKRHHPRA
jgi:hypothetical protein